MDVNLTPELEALIRKQVESGRYNSAAEVMREALRLMEQRDELWDLHKAEIRRKIDDGLASLARGNMIDGEEFFASLEREEEDLFRKRA
jgi:antitoxin ParD1/3/4